MFVEYSPLDMKEMYREADENCGKERDNRKEEGESREREREKEKKKGGDIYIYIYI